MTGIQVRTDDLGVKRVKAVETAHGTIETPCVVNCAGKTLNSLTLLMTAEPLFMLLRNMSASVDDGGFEF